MRITQISIKNYRSCINTTFEPGTNLAALIGPNGSGKTNVLSAIRLLPTLCHTRFRRPAENDAPGATSEIKTTYEIAGKKVIHTATLNLLNNEKNQDEILAAEESWYLYDFTGKKNRLHIPSWVFAELEKESSIGTTRLNARSSGFIEFLHSRGIDSATIKILQEIVRSISAISYYSASQFTNPGSCPISFEVEADNKRRTGISITGHKKFLYDMYQEHRNKSESYAEFIDLVGDNGIGLVKNIDFKEITTSSSNYNVLTGGKYVKKERQNLLVIPSFEIAGNTLSPSQLSEGTFKTLALVFYLVTDKSSILMLEEPEVCVHHGLLNSIIELIRTYSNEKQIILTTHSDAVIDQLDVDNVFSVKRIAPSGTVVSNIKKRMKAEELKALKDYLANEGSLGEYWKHGDLENV
ncbi:AAA family ATPase [Paraburkholderia sediminicola]|uniref:AAA family ATPase n=1 Tax=Paraburkholderia sediminicola TaxID=458836 RepID=UPI0038BB5CD8